MILQLCQNAFGRNLGKKAMMPEILEEIQQSKRGVNLSHFGGGGENILRWGGTYYGGGET